MEAKPVSNGLSGLIWAVILIAGGLGLIALLALVGSMFGLNAPGLTS